MSIDHAAKVYQVARNVMLTLSALAPVLKTFQLLQKEDLKASTAVADSNRRNQRQEELSWIWQTISDKEDPAFLKESKCIYILVPW